MGDQKEHWGPWITHDGRGIPVPVGTIVHVVGHRGSESVARCEIREEDVPRDLTTAWHWATWGQENIRRHERVVRYRVRKPRGLVMLEGLLEALDQPEACGVAP
jgi:hypothetical protein